MKVLGIVCSPTIGGNTETLVMKSLAGAAEKGAETDLISFANINVKPCDGCRSCTKTGECVIDDDMKNVYPKLFLADGIIMGTPVYFWTFTAQAKLLIDRTYSLNHGKKLKNKICGCIAVAGRRGTANALAALNMFFLGQGMRPISNGVSVYGSGRGDVKKDERGMREAHDLGAMIAETIAKQK
jgi:multimeric flavodoxin WrbA